MAQKFCAGFPGLSAIFDRDSETGSRDPTMYFVADEVASLLDPPQLHDRLDRKEMTLDDVLTLAALHSAHGSAVPHGTPIPR